MRYTGTDIQTDRVRQMRIADRDGQGQTKTEGDRQGQNTGNRQ